MPIFKLNRRALSFQAMTNRLPAMTDPLEFLNSVGSTIPVRDAYQQIHGAIHASLSDVERSVQAVFERLGPESTITERMIQDANDDIRTDLALASTFAGAKRDELILETVARVERLYIQRLIISSDQEPPVRRWNDLADRAIRRDLPPVSEPGQTHLDVPSSERRKRLGRWRAETDEWLETLCLNHVGEVIRTLLAEVTEYTATWNESVYELRRHSNVGGQLFQQVTDAEYWTFQSDDPTVKNLLVGEQAQDIAARILNRFQMGNKDLAGISRSVREGLEGKRVYGPSRVDTQELAELIAVAIAQKIRETVSVDTGFLSLVSSGAKFGEELGELLADMHMGTVAMEEKMWRIGEVRVGHVDSAAGVGITSSNLHDSVIRGLGGGRKFAAVEGHPGDNHRFEVQMSTVGAPISDLSIYREMVNAWYAWHFDDSRGANGQNSDWMETLKKESWKLYPDIGQDTGVRNAIVELIDDDLKGIWNGREDIATRLANAQLSDEDQDVIKGLRNGARRAASINSNPNYDENE